MGSKIGVMGLWHLGCVLSAVWSEIGHSVVGCDDDPRRVDGLKAGKPPVFEPGLAEMIARHVFEGRLSFSTAPAALADCDYVFLAYDTPVLDDDCSDLSILERSVENLRRVMKRGSVLIVSSQSPAGFCRILRERLREANESLDLAYSPENLRLGEALACYRNPGRIILGTADPQTERRCLELFSAISGEVLPMTLESAEMVKHGINSFLANSIVFANQLAELCETSGARIDDVVRGMKSDPRIGPKAYLAPGIGFSGGTLGRDLKVLEAHNRECGGQATLFETLHALNARRKFSVVNRAERIIGALAGRVVGVLGVTYKPGTSTLRRSLPLEIVGLLMERGCHVRVYDPKADYAELPEAPAFEIAASVEQVAAGVDLLLLLTDWPQFKQQNWGAVAAGMRRPLFYDTRNLLLESEMRRAGFAFYSTGRG